MLARAFVADAVADVVGRLVGREQLWGVDPAQLAPAHDFVAAHRAPEFLEALADQCAKQGTGPTHLGSDFELVADTFRRFADDKIRPAAEHVHRTNADVPEEIIAGLAEIGGFGLSVPEEYDGFATGGESDYIGMVVATEELSRGSLGIGGSLVTRPEILTRALVAGGTEEQKQTWLPAHRERRVDGRHHGHRARLRLRRRGRQGRGDTDRRRLAGHRREDVGHLRGPRRRVDAAGPHRPRQVEGAPRPLGDDRREAPRRGSLVRVRRRPGREDGRPRHRHDRLPRHALLRGRVRQLVRSGREPHRRRGRSRPRVLLPDGGLRERAPADRGARRRPDAGRVRSRHVVRPGPQGLRQPGVRLPAVEGEARAHGHAHPGRPPVLLRRRPQDGRRRGHPRSVDGEGVRVPRGRVGHPRGDATPRRHGLRRGVPRLALLRRRPGAVDLRRRRRDAVPPRHRPPPLRKRPRKLQPRTPVIGRCGTCRRARPA